MRKRGRQNINETIITHKTYNIKLFKPSQYKRYQMYRVTKFLENSKQFITYLSLL